MANLTGTNLAAAIVPFTTDDIYPTHLSTYGKGGYREVETLLERDAIPLNRRMNGMLVYVIETDITYQLKGGLNNFFWVEYKVAASSLDKYIQIVANGNISGHRVITSEGSYASSDNINTRHKIVGITTNAASNGDILYVRYEGEIQEVSWNWQLDKPIFLGTNGMLTQTTPTSGFIKIIANVITSNKINLYLQSPNILI